MRRIAMLMVLGLACSESPAAELPTPVVPVGLPLMPPPQWPGSMRPGPATEDIQQRIASMRARQQAARGALLTGYPELFQGPQQTGLFLAAMLLSPDGKVLRTARILLPDEQLRQNGTYTWQPWQVTGGMSSNDTLARGTMVQGKPVRIDVAMSVTSVPANYDESRSVLRVHDAVLAKHSDLIRPDGPQVNWLRVQMNEDGTIARHHVELLDIGKMTPETPVGPSAYARLADQFDVLGLEDDQLGVMGLTGVEAMADGTPGSGPMYFAPPSFDASGRPVAESGPGMTQLRESRALIVSYVWPRRAGEPAGGAEGRGLVVNRAAPPINREVAKTIVQRAFPGVTDAMVPKDTRPVVVLSHEGAVVRAGYVDAPEQTMRRPSGEIVSSGYSIDLSSVAKLLEGAPTQQSFGDRYPNGDGELSITFFWLASPDSRPTPLTRP